MNPRPLISVFLKSRHSVLLHLYPLFKDPHCPSARNHLRSTPSLLQSHFAFPLHSYSSKQRWVVGWWDGGMVGMCCCSTPAARCGAQGSFPAPRQEQDPMAAHGPSAARRSRDAGKEAQERVRRRPRLPTSFLSVHSVNNACRRLFIFV